jgi:hypothetical protein
MIICALTKKVFYDALSSPRFPKIAHVKLYTQTLQYGYYVEDGGKVQAMGGIFPWWEGVAEVWLLQASDIHLESLTFVRAMRRLIDGLMDRNHLWRLQATALTREDRHWRLLEVLGFEREGRMIKFGPDKNDHFRYAKVK